MNASIGRAAAKPLRVVSIIPTFWPRQGGAQVVVASIAKGLGSRLDNVVLTRGYRGSPVDQRYLELRVRRYRNPAPVRWKDYATGRHHVPFAAKACVGIFDVLGSIVPLYALARRTELVHLHFPLPLGLSVLVLQKLARRPLVVTVHGNGDIYELPPALAPLTRAVLSRADAIVSVSRDLASHLADKFGVEQVTVVPNGVDTELFQPSHRPPSDTMTLLSVSRIVPRKNIPVLIAAVNALAKAGERIRVVIAGTGPEEAEVAWLAAATNGVARFVGFVSETGKRELFAEADAFVQLSTREGLSVATLEALASGLPCVVSDVPGVREPILPGVTGYLVRNPENVEDVMNALRGLLADRHRLAQMKRAARLVSEEQYSLRAMAEGYWGVYQGVLDRRTT